MNEIIGVPDWGRLARPRATERLTLRPATPEDADTMFAYRSPESVGHWMTMLPTDVVARRTDFDKRYPYALMIELDGEVIGDLFLKTENARSQTEIVEQARDVTAEIGWCTAPAHGGSGFATEAAGELLTIAFDGLGLRRVIANCFAVNEPSGASWSASACAVKRSMSARGCTATASGTTGCPMPCSPTNGVSR
ncbi:GNAT family N-acetyltransferase [Nocardioides sp. B-3]|uniref:GNAT family N-acetyltransferase n=1 Tax=Nocardioides sp. B-3 TaxID=2895565 RepID=UPI0021523BB3|nr:GNAT family protein [Nocardioides sp. B-3]UUZ58974.1 GNAT family N-acetyltransferase [Nocardioides sp. B-3]